MKPERLESEKMDGVEHARLLTRSRFKEVGLMLAEIVRKHGICEQIFWSR